MTRIYIDSAPLIYIVEEVIPIVQSTELRAHYRFKTPDAIHLAAAIVSDCSLFLTHDYRLRRCTEIAIEVIDS